MTALVGGRTEGRDGVTVAERGGVKRVLMGAPNAYVVGELDGNTIGDEAFVAAPHAAETNEKAAKLINHLQTTTPPVPRPAHV